MKAYIKALGCIVEVTFSHIIHDNGHDIIWYKTPQGASFTKDELEFITTEDDFDYWTRLEHQVAIAAMQGIWTNPYLAEIPNEKKVQYAYETSHALVEKYKKEEK